MNQNEARDNPRTIVIQKLYGHHLNRDSEINFPKHRFLVVYISRAALYWLYKNTGNVIFCEGFEHLLYGQVNLNRKRLWKVVQLFVSRIKFWGGKLFSDRESTSKSFKNCFGFNDKKYNGDQEWRWTINLSNEET